MITRSEYIKIFSLRFFGYFFVLSALAGVGLTFAPVLTSEATFRLDQIQGKRFVLAEDITKEKKEPSANLLPPIAIVPVDRRFGIVIPKINANSPVIANVNAADESAYSKALKLGVAHAAGTAYPGEVGNVFLFAHSAGNFWEVAQWNAVFYLVKELVPGDEIDIFFNGKRYYYVVTGKKIVAADEIQYLNFPVKFAQLTLQTCWPPGTALKRLLIFARLKGSS